MAELSELSVLWPDSPRIVLIDNTLADLILQDLHDTVVVRESERQGGLDDPGLISSAGKEDLGGGVTVGITSTLLDGQVAFEERTTSVASGTITTASTGGTLLIDGSASFLSGVEKGATVINLNTGAVGTIRRVDSNNQLVLLNGLSDGTNNNFTIGDSYKVWNTVQCSITGGNLVSIDDVDPAVGVAQSPIFPTAFTQILLTSSSSATLQELSAIQFASYNNRVSLDITAPAAGSPGLEGLRGSAQNPANTVEEAFEIRDAIGVKTIECIEHTILDSFADVQGITYLGRERKDVRITINPIADVLKCVFKNATITGTLDGNSEIYDCDIETLNFVEGLISNCTLTSNTITLGTTAIAEFHDTKSGVPGLNTPVIDCAGTGVVAMNGHRGGIKFLNYTGSASHTVSIDGGQVILDSNTITGGTWVIRGEGKLIDENGNYIDTGSWNGGVTIVNETSLYYLVQILRMVFNDVRVSGTIATVYEEDGVTIWKQFDLANKGRLIQ